MASPVLTPKLEARFWSKVAKGDGCWEWQAGRTRFGYGEFQVGRRPWGAHRVAYAIANGPIPEGLHVLHSCDNPPCVRPDHLRVGTPKDNRADMTLRGRLPDHWSLPLTTHQASLVLGLSQETIRRQIRKGLIRTISLPPHRYIPAAEVERYRAEHLGKVGRPKG